MSEFSCDGEAAGVHSSAFIRFTVSPAASLTSGTHRNIYVCVFKKKKRGKKEERKGAEVSALLHSVYVCLCVPVIPPMAA